MHIGTFNGWRRFILEHEMDSIKHQNANLIVFTGDLQNMRPSEILPFTNLLKTSMKNAIAVRGNHDYTEYVKLNPKEAEQQNNDFANIVRHKLGWNLLENNHITIKRGNDSIVIVGTENDGKPPFPQKANYQKALQGVAKGAFVTYASARSIGMETPYTA